MQYTYIIMYVYTHRGKTPFLKVRSIVAVYSQYTSALTFENMLGGRHARGSKDMTMDPEMSSSKCGLSARSSGSPGPKRPSPAPTAR